MKAKKISKVVKKSQDRSKRVLNFIIFLLVVILVGAAAYFFDSSNHPSKEKLKDFKIQVSFENLPILTQGFYEIWAAGEGERTLMGEFNFEDKILLDLDQKEIKNSVFSKKLDYNPQKIFVSVESEPDNIRPSKSVILEGKIKAGEVVLSCSKCKELMVKNDLTYILSTPTDGNKSYEYSGVWLIKKIEGKDTAGFPIKESPEGFVFEGWIKYQGQLLSMGRFSKNTGQDSLMDYSSLNSSPPDFPGEDFLDSAPEDLRFPARLNDGETELFVTLEPGDLSFDPSGDEPFSLYIFSALIEKGARTGQSLTVHNTLDKYMPSGIIKIK